jgi:hypothetical protein
MSSFTSVAAADDNSPLQSLPSSDDSRPNARRSLRLIPSRSLSAAQLGERALDARDDATRRAVFRERDARRDVGGGASGVSRVPIATHLRLLVEVARRS